MSEVIALAGWPPEVLAYAFAKYSRSALSIRDSIGQISADQSQKFLDTFYFQFGHASIADNAHIVLACEEVSQLATFEAEDEELWDGQERSTRYQEFGVGQGYFIPRSIRGTPLQTAYEECADILLNHYQFFSIKLFEHLVGQNPKPADMKDADYERKMRARAFDVARYFLFGGILTSFGQIVSARTLERQISRLMASEYPEMCELAEALKQACLVKPFCPEGKEEPPVAPTLVKYTEPDYYRIKLSKAMRQKATMLFDRWLFDTKKDRYVQLARPMSMNVEIAATLLYEASHYTYNDIVIFLNGMPNEVSNIIGSALELRGRRDPLPKAFSAGYKIQFDVVMDRGGERDLHRHRNCIQIHQRLGLNRGYDCPAIIDEIGLTEEYDSTMGKVARTVRKIEMEVGVDAHYLIPFAYRSATLYKMHLAQAVYMMELRSGIKGHFSYREIVCNMHKQLSEQFPFLMEKGARVTPLEQTDMLTR